MNAMKMLISLSIYVVLAVATLAQAQDYSASRKITGNVYRPYSARTYQRQAINHSQVLEYYGRRNTTVPAETAKEHAGEVRRSLEATKKELAKVTPEIKNDKVASELWEGIKTHHAKAAAACDMLDAECAKHTPEGVKIAGCCTDMVKELKAADELHDKLMKHMKVPVPATEHHQAEQPKKQ